MELMARAQNIEIVGNLIDSFVHAELYSTQQDVQSVFDMEDGFREVVAKDCSETVSWTKVTTILGNYNMRVSYKQSPYYISTYEMDLHLL